MTQDTLGDLLRDTLEDTGGDTRDPPAGSFVHRHAAHCESGVMSALLRHYGLDVSEAMAFGLSAALVFVYLPFVKVGGFPLIAYRMAPGTIIRGLEGSLGLRMHRRRYRDPDQGRADLNAHLAAGRPVGLQVSVYWLPYFPPEMRFHFNAHNLVAFGREGDDYRLSDPVFEEPVLCAGEPLHKARFVRGLFAPRGLIYYPRQVPASVDYARAIRRATAKTAQRMLRTPIPYLGVRGIRSLARRLAALPGAHQDLRYARLFVAQIIRMQEEIGTGGGGFRFLYASFLQEAADLTGEDRYHRAMQRMTEAGDAWRQFASLGARLCRAKDSDFPALAGALETCARLEEDTFRPLL